MTSKGISKGRRKGAHHNWCANHTVYHGSKQLHGSQQYKSQPALLGSKVCRSQVAIKQLECYFHSQFHRPPQLHQVLALHVKSKANRAAPFALMCHSIPPKSISNFPRHPFARLSKWLRTGQQANHRLTKSMAARPAAALVSPQLSPRLAADLSEEQRLLLQEVVGIPELAARMKARQQWGAAPIGIKARRKRFS